MKDTGLKQLYIFLAERMVKDYKLGSQKILNALKTGITVDQWVVLKFINENDGVNQVDIARLSAKDAPTTTRIIDQLVLKKLAQRKQDATDRRKFKIIITDKGEKLVKKIVPHILEHRHQAIKGISTQELNSFVQTLVKIMDNINQPQ